MTRTSGGRLALAVLAFAAVAPAQEWSKTFQVSGKPELKVNGDDGSVTIRTWDRNEISARVTTYGWKIAPSQVRVTDRQIGNRVEIEVRVPRLTFSWGNRSVKLELQVPREIRTDIHTGDGAIDATGLKGDTHLSTGDGHIEATGMDGALEARTGDGHVRIRGRFDNLTVRTGDGGVEVEIERGSKASSDWRIQTGDGRVTLRVPDGFAADLDAHTGDGHITSDLAIATSGTAHDHELRGKLNGGGAMVVVRTNDGSIRLLRM